MIDKSLNKNDEFFYKITAPCEARPFLCTFPKNRIFDGFIPFNLIMRSTVYHLTSQPASYLPTLRSVNPFLVHT
jgi:hypothetical protein